MGNTAYLGSELFQVYFSKRIVVDVKGTICGLQQAR